MLAHDQGLRWRAISHLTEEEAARFFVTAEQTNRRSSVNEPPLVTEVVLPPPESQTVKIAVLPNLSAVPIRNDFKLDSRRSANNRVHQ